MKMIKYIVGLSIVATLSFTSCSDFLDVESRNTQTTDTFYKTEGQADQALTGIYHDLLPMSLYSLMLSEVRSDNTYKENDGAQRDFSSIGRFEKNIANLSVLSNAWDDYYKLVSDANTFLEKVDKISFANEDIKKQYMAEVHFLRALAYFDLVRYWEHIPIVTKTISQAEALALPQSEAKEVYEQVIIPDLEFACANLNNSPKNYLGKAVEGHATQIAAKALLGRVYLTMAGFPLNDGSKKDLARSLFKEVIDYADANKKYWAKDSEEWKRIWISDNDNKYHIFEIQYQNGGLGLGNQMLFEACPSLYSAYTIVRIFGNHIYCERRLSEEFQKIYNEKMDARCLATIDTTKFVNTDGATPIKYTGDDFFIKFLEHKMKRSQLGYSDIDNSIVDVKDWPINHPIIRLEDVMLMYAEIVGPTMEGLNMVNRIRTRAGMDAIPACSDAEFQKYVERERRLELAFEGIRWHDLVRHNNLQAIRDMYTRYATNEETGQVNADILAFTQNVKDNMYIYPIPEAQMKVREGLYKQNEAYK